MGLIGGRAHTAQCATPEFQATLGPGALTGAPACGLKGGYPAFALLTGGDLVAGLQPLRAAPTDDFWAAFAAKPEKAQRAL